MNDYDRFCRELQAGSLGTSQYDYWANKTAAAKATHHGVMACAWGLSVLIDRIVVGTAAVTERLDHILELLEDGGATVPQGSPARVARPAGETPATKKN